MATCFNCFQQTSGSGPCPFCGWEGADQREKYPVALPPGSILNGRYIVGRVLGQGGFGITYIALDDPTGVRAAIKEYYPTEFAGRSGYDVRVLSANRAEDFAYGRDQFLSEARTLAEVRGNEHIVGIHSYFEENGTAYFVMEYVEGEALDRYLKRHGALAPEEADALLLPLMEALDWVHRKGIVHRDISPDNIIVTPEGTAKLIDFGAARYSTGEKSKSLDVILKHGFAPREQYTRRGRQGPWTDVYALAATYYYAVTGKVPPDAIDRVEQDTLQPPAALGVRMDPEAEAALMKGLAQSAQDRFQHMADFAAALDAPRRRAAEREEAERRARERREREAEEKAEAERRAREAKEEKERQRQAAREEAAHRKVEKREQTRREKEAASAETAEETAPTKPRRKWPALAFALAGVALLALAIWYGPLFLGRAMDTGGVLPENRQKAERLYEIAAKRGDADALYNLGLLYYEGEGTEQDYPKARDYFGRAAERGHLDAMYMLGVMQESGLGGAENPKLGKEWYEKAAAAGHAEAMAALGYMYYYGTGVEEDDAAALDWFEKSLEKGNNDVLADLGWMYCYGIGVEADVVHGEELLRKGVKLGDMYAMNNLGVLCERELVGTPFEAYNLYRQAAELGNSYAMSNLAWMLYWGNSYTRQNLALAREWWEKAVAQEHLDAYGPLAWMYVYGMGGDARPEDGIALLLEAADRGDADSMNRLGVLYQEGTGVEKNDETAFSWLSRAAEAGNTYGMLNLGRAFRDGCGTKRDMEQALHYMEQAAEQGNTDAMTELGYMYGTGSGVGLDYEKAREWYEKGAELGNADCFNNLGCLYEAGNGVEQNYTMAADCYLRGGNLGSVNAMKNLALLYDKGLGVEKDAGQAAYWRKKAAVAGAG